MEATANSSFSHYVNDPVANCCAILLVKYQETKHLHHYLTGSDTISYMNGDGKVSVLNTLKSGNIPGLYSALREVHHAGITE